MTDLPGDISTPARRALEGAGLTSLEKLAKKRESEIAALHGMGPKALARLKTAMKKASLKFTQPQS